VRHAVARKLPEVSQAIAGTSSGSSAAPEGLFGSSGIEMVLVRCLKFHASCLKTCDMFFLKIEAFSLKHVI
jgi:hypothetical protein